MSSQPIEALLDEVDATMDEASFHCSISNDVVRQLSRELRLRIEREQELQAELRLETDAKNNIREELENAKDTIADLRQQLEQQHYAVFEAGWNEGFQESQRPDDFPQQNRCEVIYQERFGSRQLEQQQQSEVEAATPRLYTISQKILAKLDSPTESVTAIDADELRAALAAVADKEK